MSIWRLYNSVVNWIRGEPVEEEFTLNNGLQLLVKSGDVTRETARGVVVGEDENFSGRGAVAQALLKAGGREYRRNRDELIRDKGAAVIVHSCPAGGHLNYQYVLHAIVSHHRTLPRSWDSHLTTLFFEMARVAETKGISDVVTPLLGAGRARGPLQTSTKAAIEGLSMMQPRVLQRVTILEFDRRKAKTISDTARSILSLRGTPVDPTPIQRRDPGREARESPEDLPVRALEINSQGGSMPEGSMKVTKKPHVHVEGYPGCGLITIKYNFPDGVQGPQHPAPGQPYKGTLRTAYLPNNQEGQGVLQLLQKAFARKLTFRLVQSGPDREWGVNFADIPHKTCRDGGPEKNGFPDPNYLRKVQILLAALSGQEEEPDNQESQMQMSTASKEGTSSF